MSFDYSTLITDRTRSDSDTLKTLLGKPMAEWTAEERTAFNGAVMKGSYDYTDLNRVDDCLEDLVARLGRVGCNVPGYERLKIERTVTPSSRLPEGYTEVQYIQSSGTQWIDTGFKPNQNTRIKMDCNVIGFNSGDAFLFGARIASGNTAFCLAADDANTRWFALYGNAVQNPTGTCTGKHSIDFNQNVLTLDGENSTFAKTTFQSSYNLLLFATITNGNVDSQRGNMAVYACQIYDNGNLIRDFVPCIDPTWAVGLYDLVGEKFYGNAGTGVFLAGPPRATFPEGYTQLEYIQSTGTQYINTGFKPANTTKVVADFEMTANSGSHQMIFGERPNSQGSAKGQYVLGYAGHKSPAVWRSDFGTSQVSFASSIGWGGRMTAIKDGNVCTLGSSSVTNTTSTFTASYALTLFAGNTGGEMGSYTSVKLYSCQIYDNGTLTRNFIPCKNASGAVGLYDIVGAEFYANAGSGTFAAGPVVTLETDPEEPTETLDPYTWYESDVPVPSQMARYRANVAAVRSALRLPEGTPETPETMRRLTTAEANSIEAILLALNLILNQIHTAVRHCGVTVCGSKGVRA